MKIGVLSDTHVPTLSMKVPEKIIGAFKECDLIIHAGDLVEMCVLEELGKICEVKAVHGNMDSLQVRRVLPERLVVEVEGVKIGIIHGRGAPFSLEEKVLGSFTPSPDIIIFGHSHKPLNEKKEGTVLFNPGSAANGGMRGSSSYGIIEVCAGEISPRIVECTRDDMD